MNYITFDKDRYHFNDEMQNWCSHRFGPGNWISERTVKDWRGMQVNWAIHSMFGNTTFSFKNQKDYHWFMLRWL